MYISLYALYDAVPNASIVEYILCLLYKHYIHVYLIPVICTMPNIHV